MDNLIVKIYMCLRNTWTSCDNVRQLHFTKCGEEGGKLWVLATHAVLRMQSAFSSFVHTRSLTSVCYERLVRSSQVWKLEPWDDSCLCDGHKYAQVSNVRPWAWFNTYIAGHKTKSWNKQFFSSSTYCYMEDIQGSARVWGAILLSAKELVLSRVYIPSGDSKNEPFL